MKQKLLIIVALVVGMAIGVGGTIGWQTLKLPKRFSAFAATTKPQKDGPLVAIGEFTVNLQGDSFLRVDITLEGIDTKSQTVLQAKEPFIEDKVNSVLANRTINGISGNAAREQLRKELLTALNQVSGNQIKQVLFTSFVYQ